MLHRGFCLMTRSWINLYSFPSNEKLIPGIYFACKSSYFPSAYKSYDEHGAGNIVMYLTFASSD